MIFPLQSYRVIGGCESRCTVVIICLEVTPSNDKASKNDVKLLLLEPVIFAL